MSKLSGFIKYLQEQVKNGAIYVWGGQGQVASKAFIRAHESGTHEKNALALYKKRLAAGYDPENIRCFDCSGLGMYWLYNLQKLWPGDRNANGMKGRCTLISKSQLKKGCWVFRCYKTGSSKGRAYHIGYVVDDDLRVIEARGRAYGVQKRKLNASGSGYWTHFGIPREFADEINTDTQAVFKRLLKKGTKGEDVAALQKLLNAAGDDLKVDGDFGSKTQAAVRAYQKLKRLKIDGVAGKNTITALGSVWRG